MQELTARQYYKGQALNAILKYNYAQKRDYDKGLIEDYLPMDEKEIMNEAARFADLMLEEDGRSGDSSE